jgi:beta-lactamase regulating signal transducer with metallopeptidase domain
MSVAFGTLNQASGAVLAAAANSLWQVSAAVLVAWLGTRYAPRMNAATRHLIWWVVLAAIVVSGIGGLATGISRRERAVATPVAIAVASPVPPTAAPVAEFSEPAPMPTPEPARTSSVAVRAGSWPARIFFVWLAVCLVQLGRIGWSYRYLQGIKRRAERATPEMRRDFDVWMLACGVHRPAQLLISREIVSPMAVGFRTPAVIVPEALLSEFSERELDHVLLHELAHVARRDDWSNLAARLGWAVFALHPVAVWVLRQIECEREIACDDWVVAATGEARPYAASLARLFELCFTRRRALLATGMAERASQLGDRIEMLLRRQREFNARVSLLRIAACACVLLFLVAIGSQAPRWIAFAQSEPVAAPAPVAPAKSRTTPAPKSTPTTQAQQAAPSQKTVPAQKAAPTPQVPASQAAPTAPRNGSFLAAVVAAGYGDLPVDDIIALKNSGVSANYLMDVSKSGWAKPPVRDLIELRNRGISAEYLRALHESGLGALQVRDIIELHDNGVEVAYLMDIQASGLGTYSVRQVIGLKQHGVHPELLRALKDAGYRNVEAADVMQLRDNGVEPRNLQEARQYGSSLTLKQIIKLKQAGVI